MTVTAGGPVESNRAAVSTEIVVFLAVHDRSTSAARLDAAIWPDLADAAGTRGTALSRVRKWLGVDPAGEPLLPPLRPGGRLQLSPHVLLDWDLFQQLTARGTAAGDQGLPDLLRALRLVRGRPLDELPAGRYGWLVETYLDQTMLVAIGDVAHRAARLALAAGQLPEAQQAAEAGRRADQLDERAWVALMEVEAARGTLAGARALGDQLLALIRNELDEEPSPDTQEAFRRLFPRPTRPAAQTAALSSRTGAPTAARPDALNGTVVLLDSRRPLTQEEDEVLTAACLRLIPEHASPPEPGSDGSTAGRSGEPDDPIELLRRRWAAPLRAAGLADGAQAPATTRHHAAPTDEQDEAVGNGARSLAP